jgi:hypothetical protein
MARPRFADDLQKLQIWRINAIKKLVTERVREVVPQLWGWDRSLWKQIVTVQELTKGTQDLA